MVIGIHAYQTDMGAASQMSKQPNDTRWAICASCLLVTPYEPDECPNCEQPFMRLEIHSADGASDIEQRMRGFMEGDGGRDRARTEAALVRQALTAIANGALEADRIAGSMLRILSQKAERWLG